MTRNLFTTDAGLIALLTSEPTTPRVVEIQSEFFGRWVFRSRLIRALVRFDPKAAEERLTGAQVSERVRDSVRTLVSTLHGDSEDAVVGAMRHLHVTIGVELFGTMRDHLTERFRDLDFGAEDPELEDDRC